MRRSAGDSVAAQQHGSLYYMWKQQHSEATHQVGVSRKQVFDQVVIEVLEVRTRAALQNKPQQYAVHTHTHTGASKLVGPQCEPGQQSKPK